MDKTLPKVTVVVLNWNNYGDTKRCIESLQKASYLNLEIVVVDNASKDESGKRLSDEHPELRFIINPANLGFAKGCNAGMRIALQDPECAYILLLNNDCVVTPAFLEPAIAMAEANPRIGLVGGKMLLSPELRTIWYAGGHINLWRGRAVVRGQGEVDDGRYDSPGEVGFVTGALMLIRREVTERVGLLPEEYFFGQEEYDYSVNVRRHGYVLFYVPEFVVYHYCGSSRKLSDCDMAFIYLGYRQKMILQQKYLSRMQFAAWRLSLVVYGLLLAPYMWRKLRKNADVHYKGMRFALRRAIQDHGKNSLDERVLDEFSRDYRRAFGLT